MFLNVCLQERFPIYNCYIRLLFASKMSNLKASGKALPSARAYVTTSGKFAKFETFKAVDSRGQPKKNSNQTFRTNILYLPDIRHIYIY